MKIFNRIIHTSKHIRLLIENNHNPANPDHQNLTNFLLGVYSTRILGVVIYRERHLIEKDRKRIMDQCLNFKPCDEQDSIGKAYPF